MNETPWLELTPREKDAICAKLLGLEPVCFTHQDFVHGTGWHVFNAETGGYDVLPHYTLDDSAARLLEDEIERRGTAVQDDYIRALLAVAIPDGSVVGTFWKLIRATPDKRAQAFVATLNGEQHAAMGTE